MMKKFIILFLLIFITAVSAITAQEPEPKEPADTEIEKTPEPEKEPAADTEDDDKKLNVYRKVEGTENWRYYYDLSGYKKGKYNLIIKGIDKSGNEFFKGPFNIYIDPESDIPAVHISNPTPRMRVGGQSLNIVGTCIDDDAVEFVEVKIDDGEFVRAEGKEFWSYSLDTTKLIDGKHTITVHGTDVNGIESELVTRVFNLDTANPINTITSHANGVLVSGKVHMEGMVTDLNGVKDIAMSTDGGKTFSDIKLGYNKKEDKYTFDWSINTAKMEDGPYIYWFKSTDKTNSVGYSAFLFFVDNSDPEIAILQPAPEEAVNGIVYVSGKTTDEIGITSFSYEYGDESGEIKLIPGNPYWVKDFDIRAEKGKTADIKFTAVDVTGNVIESVLKLPVDREADMPVTTLLAPQEGELVEGNVLLSGFISDDDGVKQVSYSIDGGEPVVVESGNAFSHKIANIPAGKHKLVVKGIDINDVPGKETEIEFIRAGLKARISLTGLRMDAKEDPFYPGMEVLRDKNPQLVGQIEIEDKIEKAEYRFKNNEYSDLAVKKGESNIQSFTISAGKGMQAGINSLDIRVTDEHGRVTDFSTFVYVKNYNIINENPGIYISDVRLKNRRVRITAENPLTCLFVGDKIKDAVIVPESDKVKIRKSGNYLTVAPAGSGISEKVRITVTTVYDEVFESRDMIFESAGGVDPDREGPEGRLTLASASDWDSDWTNGLMIPETAAKLEFQGVCTADAKDGEIVFNGGKSAKLSIKGDKNAVEKTFTASVPADLPFGRVDITLKLRDANKVGSELEAFFYKVAQDEPGTINDGEGIYLIDSRIAGSKVFIEESGTLRGYLNGRKIQSAVFEPESEFLSLSASGNHFIIKASAAGISEATKIKITTVNGREFSTPAYQFYCDSKAPKINLESPVTGTWLQDSISISGTATDNLAVVKLEYSLNNGTTFKDLPFEAGESGVQFSETISSGSADGQVSILFRAADEKGNISEKVVNVLRDTKPAAVTLITPPAGETVNGRITVVGRAEDANGISWVEFGETGGKPAENSAEGEESADSEESEAAQPAAFRKIAGTNIFYLDIDFSGYETLPEEFVFQVHDRSDNVARFAPVFSIDTEIDKPVADIQVPEKAAVLKSDFVISGMAFDDDGVKKIYYQLDENEVVTLDGSNNFEIPVKLDDISDNEHTIKVWAEDLGGVTGDVAESTFLISRAEPVSVLNTPDIIKTVKGKITLEGNSSDDNGIKEVYVSWDNGNTYNLAHGAEEWSYVFNTSVVTDGTYPLYIKAVDTTDTEGISATIINIDNTAPEISLDLPADGDIVSDTVLFDGRAFDNILLQELKALVTPLKDAVALDEEDSSALEKIAMEDGKVFQLPVDGIFSKQIDLGGLEPGWYNVRLEAVDKADNMCYLSKNIQIKDTVVADTVDILFPADGSSLNGFFTVSGRIQSVSKVENAVVYIDDTAVDVVEVNSSGYYALDFGNGSNEEEKSIAEGEHSLRVEATLEGGATLTSPARKIRYSRTGGYVTITSMEVGQSVTDRPWLKGTAGFYLDKVEKSDGDEYRKYQEALKENGIERIEISMDNGRTYRKAKGTAKWKFRLETEEMPDGELPIIVRAVFGNQTAVTKTILFVDDTPPEVKVLTLEEGQRINEELLILGTASDENGLDEVYINLRKGDKRSYSVPSFIQGMYIDAHLLGATDWEAGIGLTFFDQVVKLQVNMGHAPYQRSGSAFPERFYGTTFSAKILANIAQIPFGTLFKNHDLDFLSMHVAVGASFTYFSMVEEGFALYNPDEPYVIIGALLAQIEFPKIKLENMKWLNTYSTYMEGAASFISSDVQPIIKFNISFGIRIGLL